MSDLPNPHKENPWLLGGRLGSGCVGRPEHQFRLSIAAAQPPRSCTPGRTAQLNSKCLRACPVIAAASEKAARFGATHRSGIEPGHLVSAHPGIPTDFPNPQSLLTNDC